MTVQAPTGVARISASVSPDLLKKFDDVAGKSGFTDRSKALQATMRAFITEQEQTFGEGGSITGALLMVYDHEARGIDTTLTDIEHHSMTIIASSVHIHLDASHCLKVIVVRGPVAEVRGLEKRIRHVRGVLQLKLSLLRTESD